MSFEQTKSSVAAELQPFSVKTTGKWILAGEHSVLRGCPAVVFPLESRALSFDFEPSPSATGQDLRLTLTGEHGSELQILFWGVLEKACVMTQLHRQSLTGEVRIHSGIPVGAGLGASAALCVAVARWFHAMGLVGADGLSEFARHLENLFHGESSGVDIAVAVRGTPLRFRRGDAPEELKISWKPPLYISYSGQRGVTLDCVNQVKRLFETDGARAEALDRQMQKSVATAEAALRSGAREGLAPLAESINAAGACFAEWGLVEGAPDKHLAWLRSKGAIAAKPTGSGKGGYALSLWESEPPADVLKVLIPCFATPVESRKFLMNEP